MHNEKILVTHHVPLQRESGWRSKRTESESYMPGPGKVSKRPRPLVFAGGQRWSSVAPAIFGWESIPIAVSYWFPPYSGSNHSDVRRHPVKIGENRWMLLSSDKTHLRFRRQAGGRAYPLHPQLDQAPNHTLCVCGTST